MEFHGNELALIYSGLLCLKQEAEVMQGACFLNQSDPLTKVAHARLADIRNLIKDIEENSNNGGL